MPKVNITVNVTAAKVKDLRKDLEYLLLDQICQDGNRCFDSDDVYRALPKNALKDAVEAAWPEYWDDYVKCLTKESSDEGRYLDPSNFSDLKFINKHARALTLSNDLKATLREKVAADNLKELKELAAEQGYKVSKI